jgi:hypothetical protein
MTDRMKIALNQHIVTQYSNKHNNLLLPTMATLI